MNNEIKSIELIGLYGVRDFRISFKDNKLILIGENGSGKTTISRITYAVLSCNWDLLRAYPFERIVLNFADDSIEISSKLINDVFGIPDIERIEYLVDRRIAGKRSSDGFITTILNVKHEYESANQADAVNQDSRMRAYYPYEYFSKIIENPNIVAISEITERIHQLFQSKILYLPTYRRIEEQLKNIFPDVDKDVWAKGRRRINSDKVVELVEFGMDDVERLVKKEQDALKQFSQTQQNKLTLGYLSEIVSKKYDRSSSYTQIRELSDSQIQEVLRRIDSSILSDEMKKQVIEILNLVRTEHKHSYSAQVKIVCHYFMQLMSFDRDITLSEQHIRSFQEKCNKYLISNQIIYNSQDFTCQLLNRVEDDFSVENSIRFQNLSSGEKQIVSLFSHLYLDKDASVFVFIDEPELSLSVDWQRSFLPDIVNSPNCCGLIATTHSPFIFDNELETVVHGINEFCTRG
jgi:predicted ATPase